MGSKERWHEVTRTLKTLTPDQQRGAAGSNAASSLSGSILLLTKQGDQPAREWLYGRTEALRAAGNQVGFAVKPLDDGDIPELPDDVRYASHPIIPWSGRLNKTANMERLRTDISEIRKSIEAVMPPDSYVSVRVRPHGKIWEDRNIRDWIASEHNDPEDEDPLVKAGAMCARVSAGAPSKEEASQLAENVGGALFGDMSGMGSHRSRPKFGLFAFLLTVGILFAGVAAASPWTWWPSVVVPLAVTLGCVLTWMILLGLVHANVSPQCMGVMAVAWILWLTGLFPLPLASAALPIPLVVLAGVRLWRASFWDDIEQKPRRYFGVNWRVASKSDNEKDGSRDERNRTVISYGTQRSTLLMGPATVVAAFTPVGDAAAVSQMPHPIPEVLTQGGVYVGEDQSGRKGYLDATQLYNGVAIIGEAGSGKSVLTHGIMQWADKYRSRSDSSYWGWDTRVISFEMKDDGGVRTMQRFREANGLDQQWHDRYNGETKLAHVSYLADPDTPCVDLLGMRDGKSAKDTAVAIAAAMQYSFDPGAILADSLDRLTNAFTLGVAAVRYEMWVERQARNKGIEVNPSDLIHERMRLLEAQYPGAAQAKRQMSPVGWASVALCTGDGQLGAARAFGDVMRGLANMYRDRVDLQQARRAAEQLYGRPKAKIPDREVLSGCRSASTKVGQLLPCEHVFTMRRARITWDNVLASSGDFHFVLAPRHMEDGTVRQLPERLDKILGAWLMYRLWNEVAADCQGWRDKGRHTMLVCDELSMLANADPRVLSQVREQGRSFGVIPVFATQFPQQLRIQGNDDLLNSFMGYSTFVSYNTANPDMARTVAAIMSDRDDGSDGWTGAAIRNLRKYEVAVRTRTQRQAQPAFLLEVHNFDDVDVPEDRRR